MNIFVIMPFEHQFNLIYRYLIKSPLEEKGHTVRRADDNPENQSILKEIVQSISKTDLIIADLTGSNSNVYYELGIAHTLEKPTIQIVQDIKHIRFDLRAYSTVLYETRFDGTSDLSDRLLEIIENKNYKFSNPVNDYMDSDERTTITLPRTANDSNRNNEMEKSDSDDIDYGILDAKADTEDSLDELVNIVNGIRSDIENIDKKTRSHTDSIKKIQSNPNQKNLHGKVLRIMKVLASDVDDFSSNIDEKTPKLKKAWLKLDQGLGHALLVSRIETPEDREAVLYLQDNLVKMQNTQTETIGSIEFFREALKNLIGISRVSAPALRRSVKTLDRLINELQFGNSRVQRIINLITDLLD